MAEFNVSGNWDAHQNWVIFELSNNPIIYG
jgi:hypothetical protein